MKKNLYTIISLCLGISILASCNSYDDPKLNPNVEIGNPDFQVVAETLELPSTASSTTIDVTTNTKWWVVKPSSNMSFVTLNQDTVQGNGKVVATFAANTSLSERSVTLVFQSGTIGPKREVKLTQAGNPADLQLNMESKVFDSPVSQLLDVLVSCDGAWSLKAVDASGQEVPWITYYIKEGQPGNDLSVGVLFDRNTGSTREAKLIFTASKAEKIITVSQPGGATQYDSPNNTTTVYFETFNPGSPSVGATWTLTDSRDGTQYTVRYLADGKYWMASDLKFAGYKGNLSSFVFNGEAGKDNMNPLKLGSNIPGFWGSVSNISANVTDKTVGYFYDWLGAMQTDKAYYDVIFVADPLPWQGIAPKGWHLPSADEYTALTGKYNYDQLIDKSVFGAVLGGDTNEGASAHWGRNAKAYYWSSSQTMAGQGPANYKDKAAILYLQKAVAATATASATPSIVRIDYSTPKKYGCLIRLVRN